MKPLVIFHNHCADGFGAAYAAWKNFGDEADYVALSYDDPYAKAFMPAVASGRAVYILDFSFPHDVMVGIFAAAASTVWLDHHKSAFEDWCDDYQRGKVYRKETDRVLIVLDDNQSGALLAWKHFHPDTPPPALLLHIDDRDRWQFKRDSTREISEALNAYCPWRFEQWDRDLILNTPRLIEEGAALLRATHQRVQEQSKHALPCQIGGRPGRMVNTPSHISDTGHALALASGTFGLVWYVNADGKAVCSLRSTGDYDVSAIAKEFGGGGHMNAAGFTVDMETVLGFANKETERKNMVCLTNYCVQCRDITTGLIGDFLFDTEHWMNSGEFKAISPVFSSLVELFKWDDANDKRCASGYYERNTEKNHDN